ncbi:MAG: cell envelope integrity protein TolA [Pseudomonadales bacterium]
MNLWQSSIVPVSITIAMHALLAYFVIVGWELTQQPQVRHTMPQYIKAELVVLEQKAPPKPKPKPVIQKPQPKPKVKPKPKPKPKPVVKKAEPKPEPKPKEKPKPEPKAEPVPVKPKVDVLAQQQLAAMQQAMVEEEAEQQASSDQQLANSYIAVIQQTITQSWSRPASARNGMQVTLSMQLIPTGEVVDVRVLQSSGHDAFDRSAVTAVKRVERFDELANVPSRVFDKYFRKLNLVFRPEDLLL